MTKKIDVVFCKDCMTMQKRKLNMAKENDIYIMTCPKLGVMVKDNFFCAWGKRKETEK